MGNKHITGKQILYSIFILFFLIIAIRGLIDTRNEIDIIGENARLSKVICKENNMSFKNIEFGFANCYKLDNVTNEVIFKSFEIKERNETLCKGE
jgi:hypothetical protein